MSDPNNDPNHLHPSPTDSILTFDEALQILLSSTLPETRVETLVADLATLDARISAKGG